jgi:hypothetical protein
MAVLTKENAKDAVVVKNIDHPEWGTWGFLYQGQPLLEGQYADIIRHSGGSRVLFSNEYSHWEVVKFNTAGPTPGPAA